MADEGEIRSYRDLKVWQRSMEAADLLLEMVEAGPLANKYRLAGQIEAASASIPANIAEGHELATLPQYLKHLYCARGSLAETRTFLEMFQKRKYFKEEDARKLWGLCVEVSKMLNALISRLEDGSDRLPGPETSNLKPET